MFNNEVNETACQDEVRTEPEPPASGRREFLRQAALTGAGVAGLALLGQKEAAAASGAEFLPGRYLVNHNFSLNNMGIESQNGNTFTGRFDDGTRLEGCVVAPTITFNRTLPNGATQHFEGTFSTRPAGTGKDSVLAGTFHIDGSGPFAWFATGSVRP